MAASRAPQWYAATGGIAFDPAKPTVALVHGAGMDHTVWTLFTRYFARNGCNVLAFDLPGHGRTPGPVLPTIEATAAWMLGALDELGVGEVALGGHSMGSLIALAAAAEGGARVRRLALLGFSYPMQVGAPLLEAAARNEQAAIDMLMIWGHDFGAHLGGNRMPGISIVTPIKRLVERAAPGVLHNDLHACHVYEGGEAAARRVACPVTLILGDRDRMTPTRGARDFMRNFECASLTLIRECGHGMMEERPEETHQALVAALT